MEKIFFAFLDELAHSKQFKKSRENDLLLTPPPLAGKIPDNSGLFLEEGFPKAHTEACNLFPLSLIYSLFQPKVNAPLRHQDF